MISRVQGVIYNPYSVMQAVRKKKFGSEWQKTSAAGSLMTDINNTQQ